MAESAVRFGHLVGVFALLHRGAAVVGGIEQFARQAVNHGVFVAATGGLMIQRMARAWRRSVRTSTGTW